MGYSVKLMVFTQRFMICRNGQIFRKENAEGLFLLRNLYFSYNEINIFIL